MNDKDKKYRKLLEESYCAEELGKGFQKLNESWLKKATKKVVKTFKNLYNLVRGKK